MDFHTDFNTIQTLRASNTCSSRRHGPASDIMDLTYRKGAKITADGFENDRKET